MDRDISVAETPVMVRVRPWNDTVPFAVLLVLGLALDWFGAIHPAALGDWGPYEFSWPTWLALTVPVALYARGVSRQPALGQSWPRCLCFLAGVALIGVVLQSHFAFLAQHMFAATRLQHLAIHHLGPFLIALAWPFPAIRAGLPASWRIGRMPLAALQWPPVAAFLFVGLIGLWLIPPVQFRAMLDPRLYAAMNWSMTLDGLLFWSLILDPRPPARGRLGIPARILLAIVVQMPQILLGGLIASTDRDLYPVYRLCGRFLPGVGPLLDQQVGGLVIWYPAGMMSAVAVLILLRRLRRQEGRPAFCPGPAKGPWDP